VTHLTPARRRRNLVVVLVLILTVGVSGWVLGWSSLLTIKQIQVLGIAADSPLKSDVVIARSGIRIGESMARLNQRSVKRELNQLPRVGMVSLVRKWPHTVVLVIRERVPMLAVVSGNEFQLVDSKSVEYAVVPTAPVGVPTLVISGDRKIGLKTAMSVITLLPFSIRSRVTQLESSGSDGLQMTLRGGTQIIWGSSQDLALKSRVLLTILSGDGASRFKTFDVSAPYAPTAS